MGAAPPACGILIAILLDGNPMPSPHIHIPQAELAPLCQRYHVRRLSMFGSALRDDFRPDSDVDILVEFDPAHVPGLAFFLLQDELSQLLGRKVDLNTPGFLSPLFRDSVVATADTLYVAA